MKKLISFAVAVLMLLSVSIPVTFAADATVGGKASTVGSVVGLTVNGEAVESSADYIAKMGYAAEGSGWTAITSVAELRAAGGSAGGKYYLANDVEFKTAADMALTTSERWQTAEINADTIIDGCGYSIKGWDYDGAKAYLFKGNKSKTLTLKNVSFGSADDHISVKTTNMGSSVLGCFDGGLVVDNVCIWADVYCSGAQANAGLAGFVGYTGNNSNVTIKNSEMNGSVEQAGTTGSDQAGIVGFVAADRGRITIENCVNNATIKGYSYVGGILGIRDYAGSRARVVKNCVNNGTLIATAEDGVVEASAARTKYIGEAQLTVENFVNTGMITVNGVTTVSANTVCNVTSVVNPSDANKYIPTWNYAVAEAQAFIQMTDGETQDVRFILAMSAEEYAAAAEGLSFKLSFKLADGKVISHTRTDVVAFNSVVTADETFVAADGVVFCGVVVTGVPANAWTKCGISYGGNTWAYTK